MRRKGDMFKEFTDGNGAPFLPGEGEQAATTAALQTRERLAMVEEQLKSQFTSIAAYAQISQHAVETARAESRADLDREKATILTLLERLREEVLSNEPHAFPIEPAGEPSDRSTAVADQSLNAGALARIAMLEDRFDRLSDQFTQVLKSQEALADSIAFMFEHQMRASGWIPNCADATT
jgi:chromosome segregation ATPase